jgi:exonuclease III
MEDHIVKEKLILLNLQNYLLRAHYCRKTYNKGGTCIYVRNNLKNSPIDLDSYCGDKDIEVCAVHLNMNRDRICIISVYRSPSGNISTFLNSIEIILLKLSKNSVKIIICGDFSVNFREDCPMK